MPYYIYKKSKENDNFIWWLFMSYTAILLMLGNTEFFWITIYHGIWQWDMYDISKKDKENDNCFWWFCMSSTAFFLILGNTEVFWITIYYGIWQWDPQIYFIINLLFIFLKYVTVSHTAENWKIHLYYDGHKSHIYPPKLGKNICCYNLYI